MAADGIILGSPVYVEDINGIMKNWIHRMAFYSYLIFKVQQKYWQKEMHQDNIYDYEFWKKKGWLNTDCVYYIEHNAAPVKSRLARFLGSIAAKFFI